MSLISPDQVTQIASNLGYGANAPFASGMINQESGYGATSPNVGQVTQSTAAQPGFGMQPLPAAALNDPTQNVTFALELAKRKLLAQGLDPSDPKNAQALAAAQNGGGDPLYYQHVMNRMGYQGALGAAGGASALGTLPNPSSGPFQGQPLPQMPAGFGQPTQAPAQAPQVQLPGGQGNPLVAFGLGLAGGNGWHDGIAKGGENYQDALKLQEQNASTNAQLQSDTNTLNAEAPTRAAQAASLRADAWKTLNPVVTPDQAAQLNVETRGQNVQAMDAQAQLQATMAYRQMLQGASKGTPQQLVVPGPDGSVARTITQIDTPSGPQYEDASTGQRSPTLQGLNAAGAMPAQLYNAGEQRELAVTKPNDAESGKLLTAGAAADAQKQTIQSTFAAASQPGALQGPGFWKSMGRAIDTVTGTSTFGDLKDEQVAGMLSGQGNFGSIKSMIPPGSRLTNNDVNILQHAFASATTDPAARATAQSVLTNSIDRQSNIAKAWEGLSQPERDAVRRTPNGVQQFEAQQQQAWDSQHVVDPNTGAVVDPTAVQARTAPQQPSTALSAAPSAPAAPAASSSIPVGQTATGPGGKRIRWNGSGWDPLN